MKLSSPEFEDGGKMPERIGYTRENVNPELEIENVPEEAESLVLLMDDPDAVEPAGKVWDHWTVWNIDPSVGRIGPGETPEESTEGVTDFRQKGYGGPNPPDGTHTYRFRIFALDRKLDIPEDSTKEKVLDEIKGHIIDQDELNGEYDPVK